MASSGPESGQINFFMPRTTPTTSRQPSPSRSSSNAPPPGPQIMTFALQKRPRATRASVPKVRTGCVTCKKRHVKCDEEKPNCKRCMKWQGFCGGYDVPPQTAASPSSASAGSPTANTVESPQTKTPLKPRLNRPRAKPRRRGSNQSLPEPRGQSAPPLPQDGGSILTGWNELVGTLGGSFFQEEFWKGIVPQLSQENLAVRYAAMAVDSVRNIAVADSEYLSPPKSTPKGTAYDDALTYYGNAMQEMTRTQHNLRASIVCCILFVCFEILHGDRKTAIAHVFNGKRMVDELWEASLQAHPGGHYRAQRPIETDILQIFQRLALHAWASKSTESWMSAVDTGSQHPADPRIISPDGLPSSFPALGDAQFWWQVTQHHILQYDAKTSGLTAPETADDGKRSGTDGRQGLDPLGPEKGNSGKFAEWLAKWDAAFQPLFARSMANRSGSVADFLKAAWLRVEFLHLFTFVHSPIRVGLARNDDMSGYFGEVVHLCSMMLPCRAVATSLRESPFTAESTLSFALFAVVIRCQQRSICRDAFELLSQYIGEEQVWDSGRTIGRGVENAPAPGEAPLPANSASAWGVLGENPAAGDEWQVDDELTNFMIQDFG